MTSEHEVQDNKVLQLIHDKQELESSVTHLLELLEETQQLNIPIDAIESKPIIQQSPMEALSRLIAVLENQKMLKNQNHWTHKVDSTNLNKKLGEAYDRFDKHVASQLLSNSISVKQLAERMCDHNVYNSVNTAKSAITRALREQKLVGIKSGIGTKASWQIPTYQINENTMSIVEGIPEVCNVFHHNGYSVHQFLTTNMPELNNHTPIEALLKGRIDVVLKLAKGWCGYPLDEIQ